MEKITINGKEFSAWRIPTESASILLIKGTCGFLGCGYFDIATANKLGERAAIVTGVKSFDDMLNATVIKCSAAAAAAGVAVGMSGQEALLKFTQ